MEFERLYSPSLKELFAQQLRDRILAGDLPVGTRLPSERELCQQMHVSRAVVNAGMAELARQGFLEICPRQGTYVADYRRNGNLDTLVAIMHYNGEILGRDEIRSILEVRWGLEKMAVARAIDFASETELEALGGYVNALEASPGPQQAAELAYGFHHEMTIAGGNTILPLIYSSFRAPCTALWVRFCRKYGTAALYANMRELYRCILNRDKEAAEKWVDAYLAEAVDGRRQIYQG